MGWRALLIVAALAFVPAGASAAPYFSFMPDYKSPVSVDALGALDQEFLPLNNRLSAISFWLSNADQAGDVRFTLLGPTGATIATRTQTIPPLSDTDGTEVQVLLPSQVAVNGARPYRVHIEPLAVPLRVWRAGSGGLLAGSAGFPEAKYGNAVIDDEPQPWSFAYALHESAESDAPQSGTVTAVQSLIGQVRLVFTANEPVQYTVSYGTRSVPWTATTEPCVPANTPCTALLTVTPGTSYSYSLSMRDAWNNEATTTGSFTAAGVGPTDAATPTATPPASTTPTPVASQPPMTDDGTPPVISDPRLVGLTPTTATFAWSTDEAATSWLVILIRPELTAHSGTLDNTLELEHYLMMSGLPPDQYLRARITSADAFGNASIIAIDFQTPAETAATPVPSASPGASGSASPSASPSPSPSYSVVASPGPSPSTSPDASETPPAASSSAAASTPGVVAVVDSSGNGSATWVPSIACENEFGYRIDIFDADNGLIASLKTPCDTTSVALPAGTQRGARVIVYAIHGDAFEKIALEAIVGNPPPESSFQFSLMWTIGGLVALVALGFAWARQRRRIPPIPMTPPDAPFMGGAARR